MQFCRECNNLMDPVEDKEKSKLMYVCKNCNVEPIYTEQMVVYTNDLREAEEERQVSWKDIPYDPTLHRADIDCPTCNYHQAVLYEVQYADTITLYFVCASCAHHWTSRDAEAHQAQVDAEAQAQAQGEPTQLDDADAYAQQAQAATQLDNQEIDDLF
eukprot:TRINITY_DN6629_c0_g1_i2.p2 TRINITY_DN6629_c0_g1~~TRINITY_DN6629_c0_g1_i2.p2  ORF type:complete len:158 (+),score=36.36 TRINITY_DN6629_c0_g1_i2:42-515(+)